MRLSVRFPIDYSVVSFANITWIPRFIEVTRACRQCNEVPQLPAAFGRLLQALPFPVALASHPLGTAGHPWPQTWAGILSTRTRGLTCVYSISCTTCNHLKQSHVN